MMKDGEFAIYLGKEYSAGKIEKGKIVLPLIHGFQRHICLDILNCCNKNRVPKTGLCFCFAAFHPG